MLVVFKLVITQYVSTATDCYATVTVTKYQAMQQLKDVLCLVILNCKCLYVFACSLKVC